MAGLPVLLSLWLSYGYMFDLWYYGVLDRMTGSWLPQWWGRLLSLGKMCADVVDQACAVGVLVCFVYETKSGIGRDIQDIGPSEFQTLLHWQFYHSIMNMVGVSLVKISIGLFLL